MKFLKQISPLLLLLGSCVPPSGGGGSFVCTDHNQCTENAPYCNASGQCVECLTAEQCGSCHKTCNEEGSCVFLEDRGDSRQYSEETVLCLPEGECEDSVNCCKLGFFCDVYSGRCLPVADYSRDCTADSGCPDGLICDLFHKVCVPQPTCKSQLNCCTVSDTISAMPLVCSAATGKCNDYEIVCNPPDAAATGTCPYLPKEQDACPVGKFCVYPGICVQCTCDDDCPAGSNLVCNAALGLCKSRYACDNSSDCPDGLLCDTSIGRCVERCDSDLQCVSGDEYCNMSLHICRPESQRPCDVDQYEVNDMKSTAARLPEKITLVEGVKCPGDQDWYILPLKRADEVTIKIYETKQGSGTIYLELQMADGTVVGTTNNGYFAKAITFTANDDGDYYLWAYTSAANVSIPYSIAITYDIGQVCEDPLEAQNGRNETAATASDIFAGYGSCRLDLSAATQKQAVCDSGTIICPGDRDYYRIEVADGHLLEATLADYTSPLEMALFDGDSLLAKATVLSDRQKLSWPGRPGGTVYLAVSGSGAQQSSYSLNVTLSDAGKLYACTEDIYDQASYNDDTETFSRASALPLTKPDPAVSLIKDISALTLCAGDRDTYHILLDDGQTELEIPAGYKFSVSLTASAAQDISLALFELRNGVFQPLAISDDGRQATIAVTAGVPLYLSVTSATLSTVIPYQLHFVLTPPPACASDKFENNDTPAAAALLEADSYSDFTLCTGDIDWYEIRPNNAAALQIDIIYDKDLPPPETKLFNSQILQSDSFSDPATWRGLLLSANILQPGHQRLRLLDNGSSSVYLLVNNNQGWPLPQYQVKITYDSTTCREDALYSLDNSSARKAYLLPMELQEPKTQLFSYYYDGLTICQGPPVEDWFAVEAGAGDELDISVIYQPGEGNLDLYLYPPSAMIADSLVNHLAYDWDDRAPYLGLLHINYTIPAGQNQQSWPFVVRPYSAVATPFDNLYALAVTLKRDCIMDNIGAWQPPAVLDGQSDQGYLTYHADSFATYSPLALPLDGSEFSGTASLCGNEDWYLLKLDDENGGTAQGLSACVAFKHEDGDIDLELYEAENLTVPVAESATKHDYERIILTSPAKKGYYYLRVFLDPRDGSKKLKYQMRVYGSDDSTAAGCIFP